MATSESQMQFASEAFRIESYCPKPDADDGKWKPLNQSSLIAWQGELRRTQLRAVRAAERESFAIQAALQTYLDYIIGATVYMPVYPREVVDDEMDEVQVAAWEAWEEWLQANRAWFSWSELIDRTYRDGEHLLRLVRRNGKTEVRFLDSLEIDDPRQQDVNTTDLNAFLMEDGLVNRDGVISDPDDVHVPLAFCHVNVATRQEIGRIPAEEVLFTKIRATAAQPRGMSLYQGAMVALGNYANLLEVERRARRLQAAYVLFKTVAGGPGAVAAVVDNATMNSRRRHDDPLGEVVGSGQIVTTNQAVEYKFATPNTNYQDAISLLREHLIPLASVTGIPLGVLLRDASNDTAATLQNNEPFQKTIYTRRENDILGTVRALHRIVMEEAIGEGKIPGIKNVKQLFSQYFVQPLCDTPVFRDRLKETQADNILRMGGSITPTQMAQNDGYSWRMANYMAQILPFVTQKQAEAGMMGAAIGSMNPGMAAKGASSGSNAANGQGTNQGPAGEIQHKDRVEP